MQNTYLQQKIHSGILILTISRPRKMNALNKKVLSELTQALIKARQTRSIEGVIITGSGTKAFVAGADIQEIAGLSPAHAERMANNGQTIFRIIESFPKPIIAAVNGFALGGGCELAMACHMRVASTNAKFGQPEINLGIIPGYGGTQRLTRYIGRAKATELLLTGQMIDADDALRLGLVNYVVAPGKTVDKATSILRQIAQKSPLAVAKVLECVQSYHNDGIDGFKKEADLFGECFKTKDAKEGTTAFLEKRQPRFRGI